MRAAGAARLRLRFRRRLRGSSLVRERHHHAGVGVPRLQGGLHRSARLERPGKRRGVRRAAAGIPRVGGQHGLHGEPLHGEQEAPPRRRLHAGRQGRRAPQPRGRGLFEPHSPHLQGNAYHFGRHRGESAPARPLRLLVRFPQALHLARFRGRSHLLRHGGALYRRDCRCPRCGPFRERSHLHRRHGVPHALAGTRGRLRDAAQVGRGFGRQACLRGELRRPVPRERPGDGRPFGGSVPPRRVRGAEPAGCAAYPKRDGRRLSPTLCAHVASFLRRGRRRAGAFRGEVYSLPAAAASASAPSARSPSIRGASSRAAPTSRCSRRPAS